MFEGIINNPLFKKFAASKAGDYFDKESLTCIMVIRAPEQDGQLLPGFDIGLYKEPVIVVTEAWRLMEHELNSSHPYRLTREEWAEFQNLKNNRT